ncbi:hypothetical protein MSG28_011659 [Choristoneura fumiferana]|uniref:Uncharacterized protein n=1 Tax=Choristoneura fumiferana TaxID=7141 RepID=A0ACC0KLW8_CHOFU|nr:hypothetical protein MSG28_011659 [Choristoneura fumiferana]
MESSILGEFNREQDAFIKGQAGGGGAATAPWMYPVAVAIMAEDSNLEKMRFDLVPKVITEENFWRNYFYRLSLICQANEADACYQRNTWNFSREQWEKDLEAELNEYEVVADKADDKQLEKEYEDLLGDGEDLK